MEVRITYRSEIYLEGKDEKEIQRLWETLNLDPVSKDDNGVTDFGYIEAVSVEDADTNEDVSRKFDIM